MVLVAGLADRALAATTADQLIALSRTGLDDDILVALIETDGSRFVLTADDILELYRQGLSNRVIRAMQATARKPRAAAPPRDAFVAPAHEAEPAPVRPPDVHVTQNVTQRVEVEAPRERHHVQTIAVPVYVAVPVVQRKPEPPVYWGWGGQRRPDSWDDGVKQETKKP
jgi:hypothetical protein